MSHCHDSISLNSLLLPPFHRAKLFVLHLHDREPVSNYDVLHPCAILRQGSLALDPFKDSVTLKLQTSAKRSATAPPLSRPAQQQCCPDRVTSRRMLHDCTVGDVWHVTVNVTEQRSLKFSHFCMTYEESQVC